MYPYGFTPPFKSASRRGFTLIELLVVIAIIAMLSTIIITSLSSARAKGRDAKRIADIKSIQLALSLYYNDNGMYPQNIYSTSGTAPNNGLAPTYLPTVPKDPSDSSNYKYAVYSTSAGNVCNTTTYLRVRYHLGAVLEDTGNSVLLPSNNANAPTQNSGTMVGFYYCSGTSDFHGVSAGCIATAGTAQPSGTDTCYDQIP